MHPIMAQAFCDELLKIAAADPKARQRWAEHIRKLRENPEYAEWMGIGPNDPDFEQYAGPEAVTKTAMTDEEKAKFKGYAAGVGGATLGAGIGIGTALGLEKLVGDALGRQRASALARGAYRYGVPAGLSALGAQLAHSAYKERQKVQQKWLDELREQQRGQDDAGGLTAP